MEDRPHSVTDLGVAGAMSAAAACPAFPHLNLHPGVSLNAGAGWGWWPSTGDQAFRLHWQNMAVKWWLPLREGGGWGSSESIVGAAWKRTPGRLLLLQPLLPLRNRYCRWQEA